MPSFQTIMNFPSVKKNPRLVLKIPQNTLPNKMFLNNKLNNQRQQTQTLTQTQTTNPSHILRRPIVQVVNGPHRPCGSCGH